MQLVRSNSRRFVPSQADEEAHQLSYLQKHLANLVSLLAEPVEGEGEESLVCEITTCPSYFNVFFTSFYSGYHNTSCIKLDSYGNNFLLYFCLLVDFSNLVGKIYSHH